MKYIKKMSLVELPKINGSVVDTFNVEDKTTNAPSIRAVEDKLSYSTEEKQIGYWIDGKPLYRRTYTSYTTQTGSNGVEYYIFDTDTNKNMKNAHGKLIFRLQQSDNYYNSVIGSAGIDFGASEISQNPGTGAIYVTRKITTQTEQFKTHGIEVTLEYTKTTD